jgi:hypothetical protein
VTHPVLRTPSPLPAWVPFAIGFIVLALADEPALGLPACLAGVTCVLVAWPRKVDVGLEGIRVRPFLGIGGRTIPYTAIRLAAPDGPKRLVVRTMRNEALTLHAGLFTRLPHDVLDRFWKAIAAGAEDGARGVERQALARSGRSTSEWRQSLRELARPATYRQATVSRDRLWTIAENPGLDLEIRGAAIVALSSLLDDTARERFRRIDAETLHPALHALLEHAANGHGEPDARIVDGALDGLAR